MSGWISLHRDITKWEWYDDINTCRVFIHCLLKANHEPAKWRGIDIDRGQFISSLSKLASETNLSVKQIRTSISKLNKTGEVASDGQAKHTVFTIKNYDKYQLEGKQTGKPRASEGQAKGKLGATNNNNNNEKNENNKNIVPPKLDWVIDYMKEKGANQSEAEKFFDYWESTGWSRKSGKVKDWQATVRTWLKNSKPIEEHNESVGTPSWFKGGCL